MAHGASDWSKLTTLWDGTNTQALYNTTPIVKLAELPALTPGSADIGTINTKYFPTTPTASYLKGSAVTVGAGDATKTDTITLSCPAYLSNLHVETTTPNATNYFKVEQFDVGDVFQRTIVEKAYDGIASDFPLNIPLSLTADDYLKLTYTNDAGAGNVAVWHCTYLWTGVAAPGTTVSSFASQSAEAVGLAFDGTYLWEQNDDTGKIYKVNASTGVLIDTFDVPRDVPRGLTHDGTYLWGVYWGDDKIYKMDPADCSVLTSFAGPAGLPTGLTHDGTYLWCSEQNGDIIYKLNPVGGAVIDSWAAPAGEVKDMAWDGTYLWCSDNSTDTIYKLNPLDGSVIDSFSTPGNETRGLTFDGAYLRSADKTDVLTYKLII